MKEEKGIDTRAVLGCACFVGIFALWTFGPFLYDLMPDNKCKKLITYIVISIVGLYVLSTALYMICISVPKAARGALEIIREIKFKDMLVGIGVYHLVIYALVTIGKMNHGSNQDLMEYEVMAFPVYIAMGIYILKPIVIIASDVIEDRRQRKARESYERYRNQIEQKKSPTEK